MYPMEKYKFYTNNRDLVVAVSSFAKKEIRGVATLSFDDDFDLEKGKQIAAARCNKEVCYRRMKKSVHDYQEALKALKKAQERLDKMEIYMNDAGEAYREAIVHENELTLM